MNQVRTTGAVVADIVAVLALVLLALLGLATTFATAGFLVLAGVAAALGATIVLLTLRLPAAVLVAAVPIGAIVFAAAVSFDGSGPVLQAPTARAMADAMQGAVTGWGELLDTLPFVDLSGPPVMVPFLLGYVGAAVGLALALRGRSAGAPVLPLFGVLVVVLLLRRRDDSLVDWYPVAFAAVALGWVVLRGVAVETQPRGEGARVRGASRGRAGRLVAAGVVVAAALAVALPLTSAARSSRGENLRGEAGELAGLADLDSPLRRFRTFTDVPGHPTGNVHRRVLFTVTGAPKGSRVRLLTLDRYDGKEWLAGNDTMAGTTADAFRRMDTRVDNPSRGPRARVQVTVTRSYRSAWVPTVGSLTSWRFLYADRRDRRLDLRYNLATSTVLLPSGLVRDDAYEFTAVVPDDRLNRSMEPWPAPVLQVTGLRRADPLLRSVLLSGAPPMQKVFALARYLRDQGRYSDGAGPGEDRYPAGHDLDRLVRGFLLAPVPVGDDEQYAAAMALLANRVGVPARVVVGAVLPRDGRVRGKDVHAWVELRVADGSWRTLPTRAFMGDEPPQRHMSPAPRPQMPPSAVAPSQQAPSPPQVREEQQQRQEATAERRSVVLRALPWLLTLLLALAVPLAKAVRRTARRRRGRPSDRMAGAWRELVDRARDLGINVPVHASRPAQARAMERATTLSSRADDGVFAAAEPDDAAVAAYWSATSAERRALGDQLPLRRRLWAPFNPVTLVRRPGSNPSD